MKDEIKEIYLSNLEWIKTHDNIGGVMGNVVFKDNMSYEEYNKLFKSGYFILCDKDYITNLQEENERLKELNVCVGCNNNPDYKSRNEKAKSLTNRTIEIIKQQPSGNDEWILERLNGINYCLDGDEE